MRYDKKEKNILLHFKGLSIRLFFNTSIFHFIGTLRCLTKFNKSKLDNGLFMNSILFGLIMECCSKFGFVVALNGQSISRLPFCLSGCFF